MVYSFSTKGIIRLVLVVCACGEWVSALPELVVSGFSWAENLAFDGIGSLFVSEHNRGELWRVALSPDNSTYVKDLHLDDGFKHFGGLSASPDGSHMFACVTFENGTYGIIATPTAPVPPGGTNAPFAMVAATPFQGNGLAFDAAGDTLFATFEGWTGDDGGVVLAVNVSSGAMRQIATHLTGADGCRFDPNTRTLFVSKLVTKQIWAFNVDTSEPIGTFPGLHQLGITHLLDDLTFAAGSTGPAIASAASANETVLLGADFLGRAVRKFRADGLGGSAVLAPPPGLTLKEPTSVRWGLGPGFDPDSVYVTEGGGVLKSQTSRRVIQFKVR